ncbi:helix-turn-helix transcriptional regulator [Kitasatospora cystarginea]|uniref:helix-turn-helix transcriptional regulator n=1 Tax=Kitasatospora cystarginea TaxID=58350 RepID=UPI0031E2810D
MSAAALPSPAGRPPGNPRSEPSGVPVLIGREDQLQALVRVLSEQGTGGASALVEGDHGSGKSALLRAVLDQVRRDGDLVLVASGEASERGFAFGVVRQLFERAVAAESEESRQALFAGHTTAAARLLEPPADTTAAEGTAPDDEALLNGLYWLAVRLSERGRLVLVIDDLHWADPASLRWLHYLLRRAGNLPLTVLATLAPGAAALEAADPGSADRLGAVHRLFRHRLALPALGAEAVAAIVQKTLGPGVAPSFAAACRSATGGNSYLLHALLSAVGAARPDLGSLTGEQLGSLLPPAVGRAVLGLVASAGADAVAVVRATAVLGGDGSAVDLVAGVAGLSQPAAEDAVHTLVHAGLLVRTEDEIGFSCPLVAEAVADAVRPSRRQELHGRAARLLLEGDAPLTEVAGHLMHGPVGDGCTAEVLRGAASQATRQGRPEQAVLFLRRALREPLSEATRASLLIGLGGAELASNVPAAVGHFQRGLELSRDPVERTAAARRLSAALFALDRYPEGLAALTGTSAALHDLDPANALRLEVDFIYGSLSQAASATSVLRRLHELSPEDAEGSTVERLLAALLSVRAMMTGSDSEAAVRYARQALVHGLNPVDDESGVYMGALLALGAAGRSELALTYADAALDAARARGSGFAYAVASSARARVHCRLGRVADCRADAANALEALEETGIDLRHSHCIAPLAILMDALTKQGKVEYAAELLERGGLSGDLNGHWTNDYVLLVRGRLRVAQGRLRDGLADFLLCGRRAQARGMPGPSVLPWRSEAALALLALGETDAARKAAEEELRSAREWGVPEIVGVALRATGLVTGGARGLELLAEASELLAETSAQLCYAQALADLGARLRLAGRAGEARDHLRRAASVAHRLGADAVAERALDELRAAGDRPRTRAFQGVEALTPTERRVAGLAAKGMTNREIAQHLFVGLRTVEVHLTNTYGKLGIDGRPRLAETLCREAAVAAAPASEP